MDQHYHKQYNISNNCTEENDYNVTFPAEMTNVSFDVIINNDSILLEENEFSLTINTDSLPNNVTAGSPSTATVMINNRQSECNNIVIVCNSHITYS